MPASHLQSLRAMAHNNAWANHRLLGACAKLTQAEFEAAQVGYLHVDWKRAGRKTP